jgi:phage tail protein X
MATITTRQGDTWDMLSYRAYGDEHHMHKLIAANIAYRDTVIFPYGVVLDVPMVEKTITAEDLPPWKR